MSQCFPIIIATVIIILAMTTTTITVTNAEVIYDQFDSGGATIISDIGGSSWFDSSRWTNILKVPSSVDTVWIDESNTYVAIDSTREIAEVKELIIGRSGESNAMESVQVDLLEGGTTLNVAANMIIGQYLESDATVYASHGSEITIGETLTIGSEGSGLVFLKGTAQITANDINICDDSTTDSTAAAKRSGCRLIMDNDSKLIVNGNKKLKLNTMIQNGLIVSSSPEIIKRFEIIESNGTTTVTIIDVLPINAPVQIAFTRGYTREYPFDG
ncbi:hypothetical protein FRACYDRAFT_236519 [Fragilariopsis cylindrus CCMP1102]|uniref:Uncharacterized protein n=1 Tax=Fragilariopsis cylindrus CCMP1102 TaxID=635003 RepID=A0A1E7FJB8_9STRA|nr:hypothetical protein FRACYDRAFT_236519 [Fragilariopsis cylindrus CCMP1102]|eukprot:OEU18247.1 hypothetical protein FRACYDRAFT_236519 [Fragilariopsis cylindrus CCMP1102]